MSTPPPPTEHDEAPDGPAPSPAVEDPTSVAPPVPATVEPEHEVEPHEEEDRPSTWQPMLYTKIALLLLVVAYAIAFVVQNTRQIKVDFVFASTRVHLIWEILLLLAVGLIGGVLLSQLYRHRRRAQLAKQGREPRDP